MAPFLFYGLVASLGWLGYEKFVKKEAHPVRLAQEKARSVIRASTNPTQLRALARGLAQSGDPAGAVAATQKANALDAISPSTSSATSPRALLRQGSTGPDVMRIQQILGLKADGIYGPKTAAAVKAFQSSRGLAVDGIVGPQTLAALSQTSGGA